MRSPLSAGAIALAVVLSAAPALADIPPPSGYVEECTLARQQKPGTECVGCGSYHGTVEKCSNLLASSGFTKACQTYGASAWSEVWCRPTGGPALPPEVAKEVYVPTAAELAASTPPGHSGCGACAAARSSGAASVGAAALVGLAALLWLRRRRPAQTGWEIAQHPDDD
jgi:MYXO-CTERM domain-containing protein